MTKNWDQYADQKRWARKQLEQGGCRACGRPRVNALFCEEHRLKALEHARAWRQRQRTATS